jgi:hypothetical protein
MPEFLNTIQYSGLIAAAGNGIVDMDLAAKHIFRKVS